MKNTDTMTKTNRYEILGSELKRLSAELKEKKREMVAAIRKLEDEYRAFRKDVYTPARAAAWDAFKSAKTTRNKKTVTENKVEKKTTAKKTTKKSKKEVKATVSDTTGCVVLDTED